MVTLSFWVCNVVVAQLTPIILASALQTFGTFYFLAGVNLIGFFFALLTLPETKVWLASISAQFAICNHAYIQGTSYSY